MADNITEETRANVEAVQKAIEEHLKAKKEVTDALRKLSRNVEEIVVEKMEGDMNATLARIVGRSIIVGVGSISLIMLATPAAPLSSLVGLAGTAIGYAIVGGSKLYEMYVKSKHEGRIKKIHSDLLKELEKYTDSQRKVFDALNIKMNILTEENNVIKNVRRIRNIVEEIEEENESLSFKELLLFIEKFKAKYISLSPQQKESLNVNDFLVKAQELMSKVDELMSNASGVARAVVSGVGVVSGIGGVAGDVIGSVSHTATAVSGAAAAAVEGTTGASVAAAVIPWLNVLQGVNILINGVFLANDVKKYMELRKMRGERWSVEKIFKERNEEFGKEMELRELIENIRDEILKGY